MGVPRARARKNKKKLFKNSAKNVKLDNISPLYMAQLRK
jgi:hypothetical protein